MGNAPSGSHHDPDSPGTDDNPSAASISGSSNPNVTIQTLSSGRDDTATQGYYAPTDAGDTLAFSITKDLNASTIGGQTIGLSRLWPGSGRMMRSYRLKIRVPRMNNASNVDSESLPFTIELSCKSFILRSTTEEAMKKVLMDGEMEVKRLRSLLSDPKKHPHILPYVRWIVGPPSSTNTNIITRPIHLLRQHGHSSLADRLVSRPFLTSIEKNWITYQILNALQSLHDVGICHGHLTTENILLTSWNWVLIGDIGCQHYKPITLPDDDPGLWIHWFEGRGSEEKGEAENHGSGNGEKKCCLAPERFYNSGKSGGNISKLTPAMDIFSLGCVLVELFLNGERALDLGDLMEYRRESEETSTLPSSLKQKLDKIESSKMRAACRHMLSLEPSARLSPNEYLERLSSNVSKKTQEAIESSTHPPIPPCFKTTLQPFMIRLRTEIQSPDVRIALAACNYSSILKATVGVVDEWGAAFFSRILGPTMRRYEGFSARHNIQQHNESSQRKSDTIQKGSGSLATLDLNELLAETEDLLRKLDYGGLRAIKQNDVSLQESILKPIHLIEHGAELLSSSSPSTPSQASLIIFLQVVFSSIRHVRRTSSKVIALKVIHRIALFSSDGIRLERIVPMVTFLLQDSEPIIKALGISVLTSVLTMVKTFPPSDAQLFPRYVFKKVAHLITDASLIVRVAFARNIAALSETSLRFLDIGHSVSLYDAAVASQDGHADHHGVKAPVFTEDSASLLGTDAPTANKDQVSSNTGVDNTTLFRNTYDSDLAMLHEVVLRWVVHITTDSSDHSSQSKQALLNDLPRLCNFFGADYSFQILPQILAFLNDRKDWQLRASLCLHLPMICVVVGRAATEQFVVPCVESALNDDEERVVNEALVCLSTLVSSSLLTRTSLLGSEVSPPSNHSDERPRREKPGVIKKAAALLLHPSETVRQNTAAFIFFSFKQLGGTDIHAFSSRILYPYLQYNPSFESVRHLVSCLKAPTTTLGPTGVMTSRKASIVNVEIEFTQKLARSLYVPSQWFSEQKFPYLPTWYQSLQRVAQMDPILNDPHFSLGIRAIEQVYGVAIPYTSQSSNKQIITSWMCSKNLSEIAKHDTDIKSLLSRPEIHILKSSCRGECGSFILVDQSLTETNLVLSKLISLAVPPLSPKHGLVRSGFDVDMKMKEQWKPKEDVLLATTSSTTEHSGPVTRLALSQDQAFFVSASSDGTAKVFELSQMKESGGDLRSCLTYNGHNKNSSSNVRVNDLSILENTHSVASVGSDGGLHVWRVDTVTSQQSHSSTQATRTQVSGNTLLKQIYPCEGEVIAVSHFSTSSASVLVYATQRGIIHSKDLRSPTEPFRLNFGPEYGYLTSLEVGKDKGWIVAGSSRGYIGVFDIRYQTMTKMWRHSRNSPINRLSNACEVSSWPLLFMGVDNNEATLFDASSGECRHTYRTLEGSLSYIDQAALPLNCLSMPYLEDVKIPKENASLNAALQISTNRPLTYNINALVGNISRSGTSHLITGGSDNMIRYWNLGCSTKSFCVTGLTQHQPLPIFDHMDVGPTSRLYICQQPPTLPSRLTESKKLPIQNRQGMVKCDHRHSDSILDLKIVDYPLMCLLSSSRDGSIKLWS